MQALRDTPSCLNNSCMCDFVAFEVTLLKYIIFNRVPRSNFQNYILKMIWFTCSSFTCFYMHLFRRVSGSWAACHYACAEVGGQLLGDNSLLLPHGLWGPDLGQQVPNAYIPPTSVLLISLNKSVNETISCIMCYIVWAKGFYFLKFVFNYVCLCVGM